MCQACLQVRPSDVVEEYLIRATQPMGPPMMGPVVITESLRQKRSRLGMSSVVAINQHGRVVSPQLRAPQWTREGTMLVSQLHDRRTKSSLGVRAPGQNHPRRGSLSLR